MMSNIYVLYCFVNSHVTPANIDHSILVNIFLIIYLLYKIIQFNLFNFEVLK